MKISTIVRVATYAFVFLILSACTNLQAVRDFTRESAQLSSYTGIIEYSLGTYDRTEAYLLPDIRSAEKKADEARQASRESLLGLHKLSFAYMATLSKLAGTDTFSIDANVSKLANSITASPALGVQSVTVDAYARLVRIVSRWVLAGAQEKAVRDMISDGGADFEKISSGMGDLVRVLRNVHDNEKKTVIHSLENMIATTKETPENYLMLALARDRLRDKRIFYAKMDALYDTAAKGMQDIQEGHHAMAENLNHLDAKEVCDKLKQLRDDIKMVHDTLSSAGI